MEGTITNGRKAPEMSVVVVVTAFPTPGHRAEAVAAFEEAIIRVHGEPRAVNVTGLLQEVETYVRRN